MNYYQCDRCGWWGVAESDMAGQRHRIARLDGDLKTAVIECGTFRPVVLADLGRDLVRPWREEECDE